MASPMNTFPSIGYGFGRIYGEFCFQANNTSTPLLSTVQGDAGQLVASFNRTAAGVIVVTLIQPYHKLVAAAADVDDTADDGAYATVGTITNEGTSTPLTFTIRTRVAAGTKADMAAGRKISVFLAFQNEAAGLR